MPPFAAEGVVIVDNATEFDIAKMKAKLAEDENKFRASAGASRQIEWRSALEFPTQTLMSEARCADLIVVEKGKSDDIYRTLDTGAAILGAGRPFLVVPAAVKSLTADHVVVGWKDTREARRAVQDALPFLHEAKRVTIVEICDKDEMDASRETVSMMSSSIWRSTGSRLSVGSKSTRTDLVRIKSSGSPRTKGPICW